MSKTPTAHISAAPGDIAEGILLPGDPLRAKFIAENFLENPVCFNEVRNMLGYTGTYKGKRVSVMGTGMGMPSIGIYSYELIHYYGVKKLIRVGTCGGMQPYVKPRDIIIGMGACTDSRYLEQFNMNGTYAPIASYELLEAAVTATKANGATYYVGNIASGDAFYGVNRQKNNPWREMGVLGAEMEAAALYANAAYAGVDALCICTCSDTAEIKTTSEEREKSFTAMMEIALETLHATL